MKYKKEKVASLIFSFICFFIANLIAGPADTDETHLKTSSVGKLGHRRANASFQAELEMLRKKAAAKRLVDAEKERRNKISYTKRDYDDGRESPLSSPKGKIRIQGAVPQDFYEEICSRLQKLLTEEGS